MLRMKRWSWGRWVILTTVSTTRVGAEVSSSNWGVELNKIYLVSQSCVCDDHGGGGQRRILAMKEYLLITMYGQKLTGWDETK